MGTERDIRVESERRTQEESLTVRVIGLARAEVVAEHPYLSAAVNLLEVRLQRMGLKFATDGRTLWADPALVLGDFVRTRRAPTHDLVHVLLHCLLLHPFVGEDERIDRDAWSLACDIVVERIAQGLLGPREGERGRAIGMVVDQLRCDLGAEPTVERVYRALAAGRYANVRGTWEKVFAVDDPARWYPERSDRGEEHGEGTQDEDGSRQHAPSGAPRDGGGAGKETRGPGSSGGARASGTEPRGATQNADGERDERQDGARRLAAHQRDDARERWRRAARSVRVDLEMVSRSQGEELGDLRRHLAVSDRRRQDLREFLRKFSSMQETLRVSPDEFDYVFYSYGLALYGNLPLIEQLEYREQRAIRDFVIVLDTSGSVEGAAVETFVDTTFDVLTRQATFARGSVVHVIQADAGVQEDARIASREDLERWKSDFELKGLGGTDFRPAFAYVDGLVETGELRNLAGLLYFTDGWGTYPTRPPRYKTAFVFYDDEHLPERVPPWAIRLVLSPRDLDATREGGQA